MQTTILNSKTVAMRNAVYHSVKFLLLTSIVILGACQKEKDNQSTNKCELNTSTIAGNYAFTSMKYNANATASEQDWKQFMDPCERDDNIFFSANGTYTYTDKGMICSPNGDDGGTWSLNGNTITSDGVVNGTVEKFDCKSLTFYLQDILIPGDKLTCVLTRQ
jgi:hypothetical protein